MNRADIARLLTKMAAFDQRTIGDADVAAWHEVLAGVELPDALQAVARHYAESDKRMMPAHVIQLVRRIRAERPVPAPPRALPSRFEDDPDREAAMARNRVKTLAVLDLVAERLAARERGEPGPAGPCTALTARWCPVHGDCACLTGSDSLTSMDDPGCPLHGPASEHATTAWRATDDQP